MVARSAIDLWFLISGMDTPAYDISFFSFFFFIFILLFWFFFKVFGSGWKRGEIHELDE